MLNTTPNFPDRLYRVWGTVTEVSPGLILIAGISEFSRLGNEIRVRTRQGEVFGEVLAVSGEHVKAMLYGESDAIRIGDRAVLDARALAAAEAEAEA